MGGSSLGPEVIAETLGGNPVGRAFTCWTAPIPHKSGPSAGGNFGNSLFIISSKSGSTLEPNIFMEYFFDRVGAVRGKEKAGEQFVAVTDPGHALEGRAGSSALPTSSMA